MVEGLRIPRVIGHRGAAATAPENTLAGFRRAAELGCEWVEFDVRLSGDDHPILFHDDTLERTTDGMGAVNATPLKELLRLDAGGHFGPEFRGERIPTLEQALALLNKLGLGFDLEMKAEEEREDVLAAAVARAVARLWTQTSPPILVTSFSETAVAAVAREAPGISRGFLTDLLPVDWRARSRHLGAAAIVCDHETLRPETARAVQEAGFSLLTYTVNAPARARELFGWGVDGVISDTPASILAGLPVDRFSSRNTP